MQNLETTSTDRQSIVNDAIAENFSGVAHVHYQDNAVYILEFLDELDVPDERIPEFIHSLGMNSHYADQIGLDGIIYGYEDAVRAVQNEYSYPRNKELRDNPEGTVQLTRMAIERMRRNANEPSPLEILNQDDDDDGDETPGTGFKEGLNGALLLILQKLINQGSSDESMTWWNNFAHQRGIRVQKAFRSSYIPWPKK